MGFIISEVIRKPRHDEIADKPAQFHPLKGLHLELLENKKKLKPGVDPTAKSPLLNKKDKNKHHRSRHERSYHPDADHSKRARHSVAGTASLFSKRNSGYDQSKSRESRQNSDDFSHEKISEGMESFPGRSAGSSPAESEIEFENNMGMSEGSSKDSLLGELEDNVSDEDDLVDEIGEKSSKGEESEEEESEEEDEEEMTPEELEAKRRSEIEHEYFILRKKYPNADLPEYNEHSDLAVMESSLKRDEFSLGFDENVESLKSYLMSGFIFIEWVSCMFIGIDMKNFSTFQGKQMKKYDGMLVELSDRKYTRWSKNVPVEIRLLGFCTLQAGIFFLIKSISSKYGKSAGTLFSAVAGIDIDIEDFENERRHQPQSSPQSQPKAKTWRGPGVKAEDIRNMYK
ncbi:hypothetical protein OAG24_00275 [bacterium]|nr:hypothetical protein [bacterium]